MMRDGYGMVLNVCVCVRADVGRPNIGGQAVEGGGGGAGGGDGGQWECSTLAVSWERGVGEGGTAVRLALDVYDTWHICGNIV